MSLKFHWTVLLLVAAPMLVSVVSPSRAAELPQYVKGPVSGLIFDCQAAKEKPPVQDAYVTSADIDGDGRPDYVVDTARGCRANRELYCSAEGCSIDVYLSSISGLGGSFKTKAFRVGRHGTKPALILSKGEAACATAAARDCTVTFVFDGKALAAAP